jgi:cytochrome b pre-mRNA-processing protein 3
MFQRLFGREKSQNRQIVDALYEKIVAAARQEVFFSAWGVPDIALGRFEMISLHMFLFQHRLRRETGVAREIAQEIIDDFFTEVDHSLRELGIGDAGVPKRMRKLARMFYGRTVSYGAALEAGDINELEVALARNIRPDVAAWPYAADLASYVVAAYEALGRQRVEDICAGSIEFPAPLAD